MCGSTKALCIALINGHVIRNIVISLNENQSLIILKCYHLQDIARDTFYM